MTRPWAKRGGPKARRVRLALAAATLAALTAAGGATSGSAATEPLLELSGDGIEVNLPGGAGGEGICLQLLQGGAGLEALLDAGCDPPAPPPPAEDSEPADDRGPQDDGTGGGSVSGGTGGHGGTADGGGSNGVGEGSIGATGGRGDSEADASVAVDEDEDRAREPLDEPVDRNADGTPTDTNPGLTVADYGAAPIGVPNFVIDQFSIPPFLLPIYQACGTQYGIPWQVLASINRIETAFGTNLNVSSAGALGWMQFIPSSWRAYGVDANDDGRKDPYNPVDAICAAARYLRAAGGQDDLRTAIFAYNHADWYVDEVLLYANQYGKLPPDLVGSLTGLTEGARFPVAADARYADDISERRAAKRSTPLNERPQRRPGSASLRSASQRAYGNAADVISSSPTRRGINIFAREGAPVVAVNDGVITDVGKSKKLGRYMVLRDAYGNRFTYARLGRVARTYRLERTVDPGAFDLPEPAAEGRRLFALPERQDQPRKEREQGKRLALREGVKVPAGTALGKIGDVGRLAPHLHFAIRPAGRGTKKIDPKPILDGWKLLEATAIYRAAGKNPFLEGASIGQVLLMSKPQLVQRTLADPRLEIYSCGREDIQTGQIDRRVLALLEYLAERGFRLTVTSLKCGHSIYTSSGNVSHHSSGNAVDIAQINGIPVLGNQGPGSITEALVSDVMKLQGSMAPAQIISLMDFGANTYAMGDHDDHVHVGYQPLYGPGSTSATKQFNQILKPDQWERLIDRIGEIDNPTVPTSPSRYATRASKAHTAE